MNKLIIENKSDLPWLDVLAYVAGVINMGRISNDGKQYCYASSFKLEGQQDQEQTPA